MARRQMYGTWAPEGRGKGKRRFAPQGAWRSGGHSQDVEAVVWLGEGLPRPAIPPPQQQQPSGLKPKGRKDEYHLAELAREFWGNNLPEEQRKKFMPSLVEGIYTTVKKTNYAYRPIMALEYSQYLENYLWPNFTSDRCTQAYLMSVVMVVNEKWRERVPAWLAFEAQPDNFPYFFKKVLEASLSPLEDSKYTLKERTMLLLFLVYCFNSLEVDLIREQLQRLVSLSMWRNLLSSRLNEELQTMPKLKKYWRSLQKKERQADDETRAMSQRDSNFLTQLMQIFLQILSSIPRKGEVKEDAVSYCERMLELLTDLEAQLPTRRYFNTLLDNSHFIVKCSLSNLAKREPEGHLFKQLLERLKFYAGFEINDRSGSSLTDHDMTEIHYKRIVSLQRAAFKLFPDLRRFALSNVASVDTQQSLLSHFGGLSQKTLHDIAAHLHLVPPLSSCPSPLDRDLLLALLVARHERRQSQLEEINDTPLYPTEEVLWDENVVPSDYYNGETCLALPKLNLQFLTLHDYLLRNYSLFRLESTYEIRENIEDAISRLKPWVNPEGITHFSGWARMALPITTFSIVEVGKPNVGENRPSRVKADITLELAVNDSVKKEWEGLRQHDVCFVLTVRAKMGLQEKFDWSKSFVSQSGVEYVRGCEVVGMLDDSGRVIEEGPDPRPVLSGNTRTFRVWLDTNQYQRDMGRVVKGEEDVYETFNVLMRRKSKENNFKAVLETIRALMNAECVVPDWLHDTFLGYGDPSAASYNRLPTTIGRLDFNDTFLSFDHIKASFPQYTVKCTVEDVGKQVPPFKLTFPEQRQPLKRKLASRDKATPTTGNDTEKEEEKVLLVEPYTIPNRGPYPYNQPKRNSIPFTATQVEAIRSGMQPGLTLVVGPPGTGKTDVAVQIISNLYHNFPEQRTLLVTHSNQALNQLFEKIMALDIDERHLLRLGHGEEELQTEKDFSRFGRVNFILALRMELLKEVERLQNSLDVGGDVAYTCETASHFYLYQVLSRWEQYANKIKSLSKKPEGVEAINTLFPFHQYFSNAPQPLFTGDSFQHDWEIAEGCFRHLSKIFKQLEEFRPFELLRSSRDRIHYLLVKEAKIIAMTCTHAALKRKDLVKLAFKYDNVLMEESAQILEIESFIPLMLQNPQDGYNQLKRVVMIGDHHQLPPVVQNMAFQKYSNMEQSMFTRFVRLRVPTVQLDAQGRARPELCQLYNWRYKTLGDLPHVMEWPEYCVANSGFAFLYQLINVEDLNGIGESEPTPYFYQNLAEAEYAVALFMYMRLQGYPPERIAILTTYNGQKHLLRDVLNKRCANNPVFGLPEKVTTVDRYQGQQNDYIILSLVRTKNVGHLRDVRRLVVAMSRARLGLYVLARVSLFQGCTELQPAFQLMMRTPLQLHLVPSEFYPTSRPARMAPNREMFVVGSMTQLAHYVFEDYQMRIDALRAQAMERKQKFVEMEDDSFAPPPTEEKDEPMTTEEEMEGKDEGREEGTEMKVEEDKKGVEEDKEEAEEDKNEAEEDKKEAEEDKTGVEEDKKEVEEDKEAEEETEPTVDPGESESQNIETREEGEEKESGVEEDKTGVEENMKEVEEDKKEAEEETEPTVDPEESESQNIETREEGEEKESGVKEDKTGVEENMKEVEEETEPTVDPGESESQNIETREEGEEKESGVKEDKTGVEQNKKEVEEDKKEAEEETEPTVDPGESESQNSETKEEGEEKESGVKASKEEEEEERERENEGEEAEEMEEEEEKQPLSSENLQEMENQEDVTEQKLPTQEEEKMDL